MIPPSARHVFPPNIHIFAGCENVFLFFLLLVGEKAIEEKIVELNWEARMINDLSSAI
jgi:hypothetical protein